MYRKKVFCLSVFALLMFVLGNTALANQNDPPPDYQNSPKHEEQPKSQAPQKQTRPHRTYRRNRRIKKKFMTTRFRPIGVFRFVYFGNGDFDQITDSFGLSFGLKLLQPIEFEVGASFFDISHSLFANTGFSWEIFHARGRSGAGLEMRVAVLGGYRYMYIDDRVGRDTFHAVTVSGSMEFNLWLSPRFGMQLQFTGGVGMMVSRTDLNMPIAYPEFRTAFGFLF